MSLKATETYGATTLVCDSKPFISEEKNNLTVEVKPEQTTVVDVIALPTYQAVRDALHLIKPDLKDEELTQLTPQEQKEFGVRADQLRKEGKKFIAPSAVVKILDQNGDGRINKSDRSALLARARNFAAQAPTKVGKESATPPKPSNLPQGLKPAELEKALKVLDGYFEEGRGCQPQADKKAIKDF